MVTVALSWAKRLGPKVVSRLPMSVALSTVAAVWLLGCVWSFTEQTAFARAKSFADPTLLPLVIDGLAASMAAVAFAASLDGRPALAARLGTGLAVLASAASNGLWAAERSNTAGTGSDLPTVVIGAGIPIAANIAFEVLLAELRRQVQRRRGLPAPVPLPTLRMARLLLAPPSTFRAWRLEVLDVTSPAATPPPGSDGTGSISGPGPRGPNGPGGGLAGLGGADAGEAEPDRIEFAALDDAEPPASAGLLASAPESASTPSSSPSASPASSASSVPVAPPRSQQDAAVALPVPLLAPTSDVPSGAGAAELPDLTGTCPSPEHPEGAGATPVDQGTAPPPELPAARRLPEPETGTDPTGDVEVNPKVWRLADYVRESALDPETVSGDDVVALGLCQSARNGRRLAGRAAALCAALDGATPPPRPDLSGFPRLLLAGEAPTLALVAREESR